MTIEPHPHSATAIHNRPRSRDFVTLAAAVLVTVQVVLVLLRLTGFIGWEWPLVFVPFFGTMAMTFTLLGLALVADLVMAFSIEVAGAAKRVFTK